MRTVFDVFLARPRFAAAIVVAALVAGALSLASLPMEFYPTVTRPTISVSCSYPGANAIEVMNTVAGPLEDRVNGVEGFDHMTSACSDTGTYSLTVFFQADFDRDLALMKVQAAVQEALAQLPQEVKNTGVIVGVGLTIDLGYVSCYSEHGELTRDEIVDYVFGVVSPAIQRVQGIGASSVQDEKIAMRVWMDADRMAAQGISTEEVVSAIRAQNVQASLGTIGTSPTENPDCRVLTLVAKGRLGTPAEFGAIIIKTAADGGIVYLRDIARIELGHEIYAHAGLFNDQPACILHMYQLPGANALETIDRVKALLAELEPRFPGDLKWDMTVDVSRYSRSAIFGAVKSFGFAALLAFVFLLVVFRSLRVALVPMAATLVGLSLVVTMLAVSGFFLTVLSLYALTAALVLMVGVFMSVMNACCTGRMDEIRGPVFASGAAVTVVSLVLFLAGGVQGIVIRQFAAVFAASGIATAFVSAAVMPGLSFLVLSSWRVRPAAKPFVPITGFSRFLGFAAAVALLLAAWAILSRMPRDLVPNEDFGIVLVDIKTKDGTSRSQVEEVVRKVRNRVTAVCDIEKSCTVFGEGIFSPSGENVAKMYLVLKPWSERGADETTADMVIRMREAAADIPEALVSFMIIPTVPGMGTAAYVSPLVLSMADNDPVRLASEAKRLKGILLRSPLADDVTCGYNTDSPHLRLRVDRAKCEMMGVSLATLFSTLQHYLGSIYVNDINLGTQVNRVTLMSDWGGRSSPETMAGLHVRSSSGAMVPVSTLVDYDEELGPNAVYRYNRLLYCSVDMMQKAGVSLQDAMQEVNRIFARELPRDYAMGWSGVAYEESSNPGRLELVIGLALLAVYLVLLVRFESSRKAFWLLLPSASAVFGGIGMLFVTGVPFSLYSIFSILIAVVLTTSFSLFDMEGASWRHRVAVPLLGAIMALPLVITSGAGTIGSQSFGMPLVGGYLAFVCARTIECAIRR